MPALTVPPVAHWVPAPVTKQDGKWTLKLTGMDFTLMPGSRICRSRGHRSLQNQDTRGPSGGGYYRP